MNEQKTATCQGSGSRQRITRTWQDAYERSKDRDRTKIQLTLPRRAEHKPKRENMSESNRGEHRLTDTMAPMQIAPVFGREQRPLRVSLLLPGVPAMHDGPFGARTQRTHDRTHRETRITAGPRSQRDAATRRRGVEGRGSGRP